MSMVPDITAGTGTESDETSVGGGSVGWRSRKEHRRGSFPSTVSFRVSDELGVGRRSIYDLCGLAQSEGAQERVLSVDGLFPSVRRARSWPTLDLHYGDR